MLLGLFSIMVRHSRGRHVFSFSLLLVTKKVMKRIRNGMVALMHGVIAWATRCQQYEGDENSSVVIVTFLQSSIIFPQQSKTKKYNSFDNMKLSLALTSALVSLANIVDAQNGVHVQIGTYGNVSVFEGIIIIKYSPPAKNFSAQSFISHSTAAFSLLPRPFSLCCQWGVIKKKHGMLRTVFSLKDSLSDGSDKRENGARCALDSDCASNHCAWDFTCKDKVPDGGACTEDDDCESGQCIVTTCGAKAENDSSCAEDDDCASDFCGWDFKCHAKKNAGEACVNDNDCISGDCDWEGWKRICKA